ncbi:MAG: YidC/Oxa1 family insertase periplasmic-domain containing protein, partial [Acidobacteria bacterium]|nr:YidC/Oxa1 family insertase periplasmic-domain containing protein [Acidobacteriota bacterium]
YLTPPIGVAQLQDGKVNRYESDKASDEHVAAPIGWAGVEDNYFALLATSSKNRFDGLDVIRRGVKEKVGGEEVTHHFIATAVPLRPGENYLVFAGPKDPEILRAVDSRAGGVGLENAINYGMLASVVRPVVDFVLLPVLNFTYRYVHNYGLAIIVITFLINMFFFPLKWKSTLKMRMAAAHQPRMKELQDRIKSLKKDDPQFQALQLEQVKLMKEANPLGGCLPMLLQLPIFWAFYTLLTVSIDVRHAPFFGWIDNLSAPDRFHILPVVMCLSMMAQSAMMPSMGQQSNPSQKIMMYVMPVVLTAFFFWQAPSGLVLYWLFSNLVGAGQQLVINRLNPPTPAPDTTSTKQKKRAA